MTSEFTLIEAAGGRPKVAGTAYSGGKMNLPGWRNPVVVDLSGMEIPETVPLLTNHENRTDARIGMVRAKVEGSALLIEGEILSESEAAGGIVAQVFINGGLAAVQKQRLAVVIIAVAAVFTNKAHTVLAQRELGHKHHKLLPGRERLFHKVKAMLQCLAGLPH